MGGADQYVALVASLPSSERLFRAKQPPLSRLRLEHRLRALTEAHAATLAVIEDAMSWRAYPMAISDAEAIARVERAIEAIPQPSLAAVVAERLEVRLAVAALRLRDDDQGPARVAAWGARGRRFAAGWDDPAFKMRRRYPWLSKAAALHARRDPKALERHILEVTFRQLQRRAAWHQFDFEAVAIYVLKWSIFDRWARLNAEAAGRRFEALVHAALADFPDLQQDGEADVVAAG